MKLKLIGEKKVVLLLHEALMYFLNLKETMLNFIVIPVFTYFQQFFFSL